jgi:hypothetical protein
MSEKIRGFWKGNDASLNLFAPNHNGRGGDIRARVTPSIEANWFTWVVWGENGNRIDDGRVRGGDVACEAAEAAIVASGLDFEVDPSVEVQEIRAGLADVAITLGLNPMSSIQDALMKAQNVMSQIHTLGASPLRGDWERDEDGGMTLYGPAPFDHGETAALGIVWKSGFWAAYNPHGPNITGNSPNEVVAMLEVESLMEASGVPFNLKIGGVSVCGSRRARPERCEHNGSIQN